MNVCSWIRGLFGGKIEAPAKSEATYLNKRALLVGINKYAIPGADLRGCVNDVLGMANILSKFFEFPKENMKIILDTEATKVGILQGLEWLIGTAKPGEELVFHYSGHGSQMPDYDNDELDKLDEILVPHDMNWSDPHQLNDDRIYQIYQRLPQGAYLTMICDSCHSGTITRAIGPAPLHNPRLILPPAHIMERIVNMKAPFLNKMGEKQRNTDDKPQRHVLLSGCKENQTSADALIGGRWQGALTSSLITEVTRNFKSNWVSMYPRVVARIKAQGFSQDPQLRGAQDLLDRSLFGK